MEMLGADLLGELHGVARAVDVGALLVLGARFQVVDGGQVEEVRDLVLQLARLGFRHAETGLGQVADDRDDAAVIGAPVFVERLQARQLDTARQKIDHAARAFQELCDQPFADETGGPGDEIVHARLLCLMSLIRGKHLGF